MFLKSHRAFFSFLICVLLLANAGCGGSSTTAPVAEDDELQAYLAENPDVGAGAGPEEME